MKGMSIDPGVTSGYCFADLNNGRLRYYPYQALDEVDDLWRRLKDFQPHFLIVEDFEFRRGKYAAGGLNLTPKELIGVARLYSLIAPHKCSFYLQKAAQGKSYYTDTVLKRHGLYKRSMPHAMDASRHLLQWCMFGAGNNYIGQMSTEEFATILDEWREE
jgi:hypothetical protein